MKRFLLTILFSALFAATYAISYDEARDRAYFLTDKMAYELNLTSEQYDRAYQINLDYFMNMRSPSDCSGYYWTYRDSDLRCILYDWQYSLYASIDYFFRPVLWTRGAWYYPILSHYRPGYFYFSRPGVYLTYTGGMWHRRGRHDPSPYIGLRPNRGFGMRDRYQSRGSFPDRPGNVERGGNRPGRPGYGMDGRVDNRNGYADRQGTFRPGQGSNRNNNRDNNSGYNQGNNRGNRDGQTGRNQNGRSSFPFTPGNSGSNRTNSGSSNRTTPGNSGRGNSSTPRGNSSPGAPSTQNRNFFQRGGSQTQQRGQSSTAPRTGNSGRGGARSI